MSRKGQLYRSPEYYRMQKQADVILERRRPPLCPRCRENNVMTAMQDMGSHYLCRRCGKVVWKRKV